MTVSNREQVKTPKILQQVVSSLSNERSASGNARIASEDSHHVSYQRYNGYIGLSSMTCIEVMNCLLTLF